MNNYKIGIPNNWKKVDLEDIAEIKIGGTPARKASEYWDTEKKTKNHWVAISDLKQKYIYDTTERISDLGVENSNVKLIPKNTVMMSFKLSLGKVAINKVDLYTNEAIASFLPLKKESFITEFMYYALQLINYSDSVDTAVKGKTLNKSKLKKLPILLPPRKEQQTIAAILSIVDETIKKTEQIIEQTETVKKGLMQQLLTKGIGNTEFIKTPFGEIPSNWEVKTLGEICERIFVGIATSTTNSYTDNGIPIIRNQNIHENWLDTNEMLYITEEFSEKNNNKKLKSGDVLTVRTGYPGITCVVPEAYQGAHTFTTLVSRPLQNIINPYFLSWFMNSHIGKKFVNGGKAGGAQQNLNVSTLNKMPIFVPPLNEQNEILKRLISIEEKINNEKKKSEIISGVKQGLMQQLLTGKLRVPINEIEEVPS